MAVVRSTEPMSQRVPGVPGRSAPRWSIGWQAALPLPGAAGLPALTAGLAAVGRWVGVGAAVVAERGDLRVERRGRRADEVLRVRR